MISDEYFQGLFNGSLLLVAVLGGPGFLLFMLYNCYRKNNVTFLDALFHFFPVLQTVKDKAESLSESAQKAAASFQSSEGIFHFYLIYRIGKSIILVNKHSNVSVIKLSRSSHLNTSAQIEYDAFDFSSGARSLGKFTFLKS